MANNLHITLTPFRNESRLLRETAALTTAGVVERVFIIALHEEDLPTEARIDSKRSVLRIALRSRKLPRTLFAQLVKYIELAWRVSRFAVRNRIDIVNVHSLALLPIGVWLKWRLRAKLVYDAHELETETNGLTGIRKRLAKLTERMLIRFVDLTIVVSNGIEDWYVAAYGRPAIVTVLNCPEDCDVSRNRLLRDELAIGETSKIALYQGNLHEGRGIETLLEAFETHNVEPFVVVFMGYGSLEPMVRAAARRSRHIFYRPAVTPDKVMAYTASADVGLSLIENTCLSYYWCLPNKVFEYVAAGLPVLVSKLPEMERFVNSNAVGVVIDELRPQSVAAGLAELQKLDAAILMGNVRQAAKKYSWAAEARTMVQAYARFVTRGAT